MRILLVTPAPPHSRKGNRITALAWARVLRALGHRVTVAEAYDGQPCDLLLALHARRSHASVSAYRRQRPGAALVVVMTGTDLYADLPGDPDARESVALADRLVVLHDEAVEALPPAARAKVRVIAQATTPVRRQAPRRHSFDVAVVGHLRAVKDPLLTAAAARLLPEAS
jgi:hypothetical protein